MAKRDYYEVLGVPRNASDKDIRQAFRRLARQCHPDVNPGNKDAEAKFKELNEAYEVISDPETRAKYDRYGHEWKHGEQHERARAAAAREGSPFTWRWSTEPGPGRVTVESFDLEDEDSPSADLFGMFTGRRRGARRSTARGEDAEHPIEISLEEAYHGATRVLQVQDGGAIRRLEVKVPPGVKTGSRVRIAGEGAPGYGPRSQKGDLYLLVTVTPHPRFERQGDDLYADVDVPLADAVLGGEIVAPTLSGKRIALTIPPETQNGRTFRLAGQGMPRLGGQGHGDLYAKVRVALPERLSPREQDLFKELRRLRA